MTMNILSLLGNIRRYLSAACLLLTALNCPAWALGQTADTPDQPPPLVSPEQFPVFPWDTIKPTKAAYEEARECGFNLAGFVHVEDLDTVHDAGLKGFVSDPSINIRGTAADGSSGLSDDQINAAVKDLVARTAKHPAVFGYHIIDEPSRKLVPTVARWAKAFSAAAPDLVAYTNFFPISSADIGPSAADYERYLELYLDAAKPKAFSFDHYSMLDDGSVRPRYFECLEAARAASLKTGVPFWQVLLGNSHFRYAEPSLASFRFQVFTSLAYGARGIGWFTYTGRDRGNYHATAIDLFGHRTPTWDMLRDVNLQIHRLAPTITQLKSVNVFHHPVVPQGCHGLESSRFVADIRGAGPFAVGEFEDAQGRPAVMVVNRDLVRSTTFALTLKQKSPMQRVSSFTGKIRPMGAEDEWLPPGEGLLLLLHE